MTRLKARRVIFMLKGEWTMNTRTDLSQLTAIASRMREMREILGWTPEEMAEKTEVSVD